MKWKDRSLEGKTILVTRPKEQAEPLITRIKERGGIPLSFPVVSIKGAKNVLKEKILDDLSSFHWIIFTSKNGVDYFFQLINDLDVSLQNHKFAAVGEKTADTLRRYGVTSILVPGRFDASDLAEVLKKQVLKDERILFPKGNLAPSYLKESLADIAHVEELIVYETTSAVDLDWSLPEKADCFFFLSPSAVSFMMKQDAIKHNSTIYKTPVFCIGPTTKASAEKSGFLHVFMPNNFTAEDMVNCAISYFQGGR
ncbi:uroporphyrinogen-III synthase [Fictibacillus barbaricus]|uniref:Uroporphyrinogen-III synthase n=1 Tax=Fictibacillus barbaricus TaxID=182136 RepID=A0ABS2ZL66_9BACL|nr:uroporphyrinogen-III synthase [Fictibacillus barbaricus]MBN3547445.1 uroporphyrinogen-III synthase [Fictibacillus barbaricus]GGB49026.1 uroporphyrinogen-III synthase [Fictibacillus barbaricus]